MISKGQREGKALSVLLRHLKASGRGIWQFESRPDDGDRTKPRPDFIVREVKTGQRAAVEMTSFDWPLDGTTVRASIKSACKQVSANVRDAVKGTFGLAVELLDARNGGLFTRTARGRTVRQLAELIKAAAPAMRVGETRRFAQPLRLLLTRYSESGDAQIGLMSSTSIDFFGEMDDLETVLYQNARKFDGFDGVGRWLVVVAMRTEETLSLMAPVLRIPPQIDELFFITYENSLPRVIEHKAIAVPDPNLLVDRERKAVLARVS